MIMPLGWDLIREYLLEKGYTQKQIDEITSICAVYLIVSSRYTQKQIDEIKEIIHKLECEDF